MTTPTPGGNPIEPGERPAPVPPPRQGQDSGATPSRPASAPPQPADTRTDQTSHIDLGEDRDTAHSHGAQTAAPTPTPPPSPPLPGTPTVPGSHGGTPYPTLHAALAAQPSVPLRTRIGARILNDVTLALIIIVIAFAVIAAVVALGIDLESVAANDSLSNPIAFVVALFIYLPLMIWVEVILVKRRGGNIGKLMLNLRVINTKDGSFLTYKQAFIRYAVYSSVPLLLGWVGRLFPQDHYGVFDIMGWVWLIVVAISIWRSAPLYQGFHDRYADSRVVRMPTTTVGNAPAPTQQPVLNTPPAG